MQNMVKYVPEVNKWIGEQGEILKISYLFLDFLLRKSGILCSLTLMTLGREGWAFTPCDAKCSEKCPCSHNNNTALIKQI